MTNLSIHLCDTSASLVLTSASFADQSISSSYAISSSWTLLTQQQISCSWASSSMSSSWAPPTSVLRYTTTASFASGPYMYNISLPFIPFRTGVGILCINNDGTSGYQSGSLLDISTINGAATVGGASTGQIFWNINENIVTVRTTNRTVGYEASWALWKATTYGDNPIGGLSSWNNFVIQVNAE